MDKLIATRPDGAKLYKTREEIREDFLGTQFVIDMGYIESNGVRSPEKEIMNLVKFNNDWEETNG